MQSKPDKDLIWILLNRASYQSSAVETAEYILKERNVIGQRESYDDYENRISGLWDKLILEQKREATRLNSSTEKSRNSVLVFNYPPKDKFIDLLWFGVFFLGVGLMNYHPFMEGYVPWFGIVVFTYAISLWQTNIYSSQDNRRSFHFFCRVFISIFCVLLYCVKSIALGQSIEFNLFFLLFLFTLSASSLISLLIYHVNSAKLLNVKCYFRRKIRFIGYLSALYIISMLVMRTQLFVVEEEVLWDENQPLSIGQFKGFPNWFTHYDAEITTDFSYEFDGNRLEYFRAVCNTGKTWCDYEDRDSYFLLQHERYHFNITEMVARMARREISRAYNTGRSDKAEIIEIIKKYRVIKDDYQLQYDVETDHSLISEMQSVWQYRIDSMLLEYAAYWSSNSVLFDVQSSRYRFCVNTAKGEIRPIYKLINGESDYGSHYQVEKDDKDRITEITSWFQGSKSKDSFLEAAKVTFEYAENKRVTKYWDNEGMPSVCSDGYFRCDRIYVEDGFYEIYFDDEGNRVYKNDIIWRSKVNTDSLARISEKRYFDSNGDRVKNSKGFYGSKFEYSDDLNENCKVWNLDEVGTPMPDNKGFFSYDRVYNDYGQLVSRYGYTQFKNKNCYTKWSYDELGRNISVEYFDADSIPFELEGGIAKVTRALDKYGNVARKSNYNRNGVLVEDEQGIASYYKRYNERNYLIVWADYDSGNRLVFDNGGYGKAVYKRDENGRVLELTNLNGYDYPVRPYSAGSKEVREYDSTGQIMTVQYFGVFDQEDTSSNGDAKYIRYADEKDNVLKMEYFDLDGNLKAIEDGVSTFVYAYDQRGNKIETRYFGPNGKLAYANQGAAVNLYTYNEKDQLIERSYLDTLQDLIEFNGSAIIQWEYDNKGNEVEVRYLDRNRQLLDSGIALTRKEYDKKNQCVSEKSFDHEFRLIKDVVREYDDRGNEISKSFYGVDRMPVWDDDSVHLYLRKYNGKHLVEEVYYGVNSEPVQGTYGMHKLKYEYDVHGRRIVGKMITYLHPNLSGFMDSIVYVTYGYDLYDREVSRRFFDTDFNPVTTSIGIHSFNYIRNSSGDVIEKINCGLNGLPVDNEDGIAMYRYTYNRNGVENNSSTYSTSETLDILEREEREMPLF